MFWWLYLIVLLLFAYLVVQAVRFYYADADLTLLFWEKFGKKPDVLKGKVAWITGASSGIGEHLAYELAKGGCRLVLSARRVEELERVKKQCLSSGPITEDDVMITRVDVTDYDSHKDITKQVLDRFKVIDILVNNAGRSQRALAINTSLEVDRQMLDLNVLGSLSMTKAVLPHMVERKSGHIVVTSSITGKIGAPYSATYTASKHALQGWFDALRLEVVEHNINVTLVCPGPTFSHFLEQAYTEDPEKKYGVAMKPTEHRMQTSRCAELMAISIANKLDETWISQHPMLLFTFMAQYMPATSKWLAKGPGSSYFHKAREGK